MSEKQKILYIDDEPDWLNTIVKALSEYEVRTVKSENEFREIIEKIEWTPDLFLIDWLLLESGEETAEELIKGLLEKYPEIPRLVLTAGLGEEGTVRKIATLKCHYIEKGSGTGAIKKKIEAILHNKGDPIQQDYVDELEKRKRKLQDEVKQLESSRDQLTKERDEFEKAKLNLEREGNFLKQLIKVSKLIVNDKVKTNKFNRELLKILIEKFDCCLGAIILFPENEGIKLFKKIGRESEEIFCSYEQCSLSDLVRSNDIIEIVKNAVRELPDDAKWDTKAILPGDIEKTTGDNLENSSIFIGIELEGVNIKKKPIVIPLENDGEASGVIFLYKKETDTFNREEKDELDGLPLSPMIQSVREMPFRTYEKQGIITSLSTFFILIINLLRRLLVFPCYILKYFILTILYLVFKIFKITNIKLYNDIKAWTSKTLNVNLKKIKRWDARKYIFTSIIEFLKLCVFLVSMGIIIGPILYIIINKNFTFEHFSLAILTVIELLITIFICILFSTGLVVLLEPDYARGLPKWMLRFREISGIDKSLLGLITITLVIHLVSKIFEKELPIIGAPDLLQFAIAGALIIIAISMIMRVLNKEQKNGK